MIHRRFGVRSNDREDKERRIAEGPRNKEDGF